MKTDLARVIAAALTLFLATAAHAAEPRVIDIVLGSHYIEPDRITIRVNQPVTFRAVNEASIVPHNLVIREPAAGIDINIDLAGGKSGSATFTPTRTGSYVMRCDKKPPFLKSHEEKGMHGILEVIE